MNTTAHFTELSAADLAPVLQVEQRAYAFPWTLESFEDVLRSGYRNRLLWQDGTLLGYSVALRGVDEVHLLNLTVTPDCQRQGWARALLDDLSQWTRSLGLRWIWLEVRESNARAQHIYRANGFESVGRRRHYYPAGRNQREDAVVMSRHLP